LPHQKSKPKIFIPRVSKCAPWTYNNLGVPLKVKSTWLGVFYCGNNVLFGYYFSLIVLHLKAYNLKTMNFSITSMLNKQDYTKVMFIGLYKKPVFILSTIVGLYLLTTVFLDHFHIISYYPSTPFFEITGGLFLVLVPTLIVMMSVYQFKSNPSFQNDIIYTFSEDGIVIQGITFKSEVSWVHITKHKEIGQFLILYHAKKFGNLIDKSKLTAEQLLFIKTNATKK
jgi:hypothetical protein